MRGCHNNLKKRRVSLQQYYVVHGKTRAECCGATFNLHPPPSSEKDRRMWLKALNSREPSEKTLLCSFHFVDGRPSDQHPYPEKWLGYVIPPANKARRMLSTQMRPPPPPPLPLDCYRLEPTSCQFVCSSSYICNL